MLTTVKSGQKAGEGSAGRRRGVAVHGNDSYLSTSKSVLSSLGESGAPEGT